MLKANWAARIKLRQSDSGTPTLHRIQVKGLNMKHIMLGLMLTALLGNAAADDYEPQYGPRDSTYIERNWKSEANRLRFDGYQSESNVNLFTPQEPEYERNDFSNPPVYPNLLRKQWGR
jgi:hypothetical protein